ncbi:hypothetical protein E2R51_16665 [Jeotgalibacillus sp. S-D1]|uniref:FixH family protein n=1 Tax=Jeotgalibacillus sp. S-D1 TaxID=2552189 RepID=UPI00105A513C|nr:FixH family protein [Jeotgalibacillus sp. S-D1]TDL30955.1 hypothetical protein E2R51_16665 [Jeotgalibacillus sp. S-D1]
MKKQMTFLLASAILLLTACNGGENSQSEEAPKVVEADIIIPDTIEPNEETVLQVKLSQDGEPVEDANDVMFEIWNDVEGGESETHDASHVGDGIYEIKMTFEETSLYSLQTHVTARDMHVMPKRQFAVGEVTEEQINTAEENARNQSSTFMESGDHDGHEH